MLQRRKAQVNWNSFNGAFAKSRRLHLVKGSDGLDHCFVTSCEHAEFASKRGCCKHAKTKHDWYYYFDEKPNVCTLPSTIDERNANKEFKTVPCCSTDNDFTHSFSKWLQSSSGGGKSRKQSDISVTRALKFIKFHCDENGEGEEEVLRTPNLIDYGLGCPQLLTKFVDALKDKGGIGQSAQICYEASISDLLDFCKFNRPPASVFQNFVVTEMYVKRARKYLAKDMQSNWTSELDIETQIGIRKLYGKSFLTHTRQCYLCYPLCHSLSVPSNKRLSSHDIPASYLANV